MPKETKPATLAEPQLNAQAKHAEKLLKKVTDDLLQYIDHDGDAVVVPVDILARACSWLKSLAVVYHHDQLRRGASLDEFLSTKLEDQLKQKKEEGEGALAGLAQLPVPSSAQILEAISTGLCHYCSKEVDEEAFCSGCGKFVCEGCEINTNLPFGRHSVELHRADPDDEDDVG